MYDQPDLSDKVQASRLSYPDPGAATVVEIVQSILSTMSGDVGVREAALLHEIGTLGAAVATVRQEIVALDVDDITLSHIPCATDELDAIVTHTAAATEAILEVCETLDALGAKIDGPVAVQLQGATSKIYGACSFQDITGQRITKVVATLKTIESTVAKIVETFGGGDVFTAREAEAMPDGNLLNGPQLPMAAMDQSDIDALLASFD